jgi:hypothetical protein
MSKILLSAAVAAIVAFTASTAYPMGGGATPPSASPYAILEPQTVNPELAAPSATFGGGAHFTAEYGATQSPGDPVHERRAHRSRHRAPAAEQ